MSSQGLAMDALNWLVFCGKAEGQAPNNILANNQPMGVIDKVFDASLVQLTINKGEPTEESDWAFAHAIVWSKTLSDSEMASVSDLIVQSLTDETIDIAKQEQCDCTACSPVSQRKSIECTVHGCRCVQCR